MSRPVSVIMPVFNGEAYLAEALDSVISQTHRDWELIVVDDGSTDRTAEIVAQVGDARIRYVHQPNRGQAAALNRGLDLAQGEYVTTLDADDRLTPNSLGDRVGWLEARPDVGAVYADGYFCDAALAPQLRFSHHRAESPVGDLYPALINTPLFGTGACVLIRMDVLRHRRLRYDEDIVMCQDWDFYIRVAEHAQFGYVDSVCVYYRVHPANMTLTLGRERHINAIVRTRFKVLESSRFRALRSSEKLEFLRRLLINTLHDRPDDQEAVLSSSHVGALLPPDHARLLRWLAAEWLLADADANRAQRLLRTAQILAPSDAKTAGLAFLLRTAPGVARRALWIWRQVRPGLLDLRTWCRAELRRVRPRAATSWR